MKQYLTNLKTESYEHPFDREALNKVKKVPILPSLVNVCMDWAMVRWRVLAMCGNNFRVTRDSCAKLHELADDVFKTLQLNHVPNLYVEQGYYINAYTTGHEENAFIALSTGSVDKLSDSELAFVIGHESGHIKSGHLLYHVMIASLAQLISRFPGASALSLPLMYWNRMSEFTADRAGLLACQDLNAALSATMKMSGLPEKYYSEASIEGFIKQARDFDQTYSHGANSAMRLIEIVDEDHPWTVIRASELIKWYESGDYQRVLDGCSGKVCPVCGHNCSSGETRCPVCDHPFVD